MGLGVPTMDTTRARTELGWTPRYTSTEALLELLEGMRDPVGAPTPPLEPMRRRTGPREGVRHRGRQQAGMTAPKDREHLPMCGASRRA